MANKEIIIKKEKELLELLKDEKKCEEIETLKINVPFFHELPKEIENLKNLKTLDLSGSSIKKLPKEIVELKNLISLKLTKTKIENLPKNIFELENLEMLSLGATKVTEIPKEIGKLKNLKEFYIYETEIQKLPQEIGELENLEIFSLFETKITTIPKEIMKLKNLINFCITETGITELPKEIFEFPNLSSSSIDDLRYALKENKKYAKNIKNGSSIKRYSQHDLRDALKENKKYTKNIKNGSSIKRYYLEYDEHEKGMSLIDKLKKDKNIFKLNSIIIGSWRGSFIDITNEYYDSEEEVLDFFIENGEKFINLKSLYFGDIDSEECEISWIEQMDYSDLWQALPNLEEITIKGSNRLVLGDIEHKNLKKITIISGGLPLRVLENIKNSTLPSLEELCLYLGDENYGYDASKEELENFILSLENKPKLKKLSLVNSEVQDLVVENILKTDYVKNLISLDFSYGTLGDRGVEPLIENLSSLTNLKSLIIDYHFISEEFQELLTNKCEELEIELTLENCVDPDTEYYYDEDDDEYHFEDRYVMISE